MKRFLTLSIVTLCAAMTSCMKPNDPDPMVGGYGMYTTGASYHFLATDPSTIALRLNAVLVELGGVEADLAVTNSNKTKLFGNATFTRTGEEIRISYPNDYTSADRDETRMGDVVVNTSGVLLNTPGAVWSITAPTSEATKAYRHISGSTTLYHEWDTYQIQRQGDHFVVTFLNFKSYYQGGSDKAATWNGSFSIEPSDMDDMGYDGLMNQPRTVTSAETSGTTIGSTAMITYRVLVPLEYEPKSTNWHVITDGKEYVSFPYLTEMDPRTYPAPSVSVSVTETTMTIYYNGLSRIYNT